MERKAQILATAERLFSERGYHATSMRDIAAALDIKGGSLYSHISGKEELLWWSLERAAYEFREAIAPFAASDAPASARLRGAIAAHVRIVAENLPAATVYFHEWRFLEGAHRAEFLARRDGYEKAMRGLVQAAIAEGTFPVSVEPKWATLLILSAANWLYQWYNPQGQLDAEAIATRFTDMLFDGFRHHGTSNAALQSTLTNSKTER